MIAFVLGLLTVLVVFAIVAVQIYGVILGFQKKWYIGLAALVFNPFAFVLGVAKLCGKDLLKDA